MADRSIRHATFTIERTYDAPPSRVFQAFADPDIKHRWFSPPEEWGPDEWEMDFRVGGRETSRGGPPGGPVHLFDSRYHDIVPDERIVYAYDMHLDDVRISVSVTTIELRPASTGTRLVLTDQGAYLDGHDSPADREHGVGAQLDAIAAALDAAA